MNIKTLAYSGPLLLVAAMLSTMVVYIRSNGKDGDDVISKNERPNFVIFFADDTGWGDLGANWKPNEQVTPNLNKMAEDGMRFTDFHSASTVCTPSRASLMTGRLGLRTGVVGGMRPGSLGGIPTNEITVAEVLLATGYHTGMIGKWHLGTEQPHTPNAKGFEYYYGIPYSNDMGCLDVPVARSYPCALCPPKNEESGLKCKRMPRSPPLPLFENQGIVEQPVDHNTLGDKYAQKAKDFIAAASKTDKPFFLYVSFAHMHTPMAHAPRFTNSSNVRTLYADTLFEMDDIIGRVMGYLKENGVYNNTMVWFTGDNGPSQAKCPDAGDPGPYIGRWLTENYGSDGTGKGTNWEGGHRQPAVAVWPDRIPPNTTSKALTSQMDLFPTIVAAAGATMPKWRRYDGMDLIDVLEGKSQTAHEALYHPNSGGTSPLGQIDTIRMGDYKIFWRTGGNGVNNRGCSRGPPVPNVFHDPPLVFNVELDPAESRPITVEEDPNYYEVLKSAAILRAKIAEDIKTDNTTRLFGGFTKEAFVCCDRSAFLCKCHKPSMLPDSFLAFLNGLSDIKKSNLGPE